MKKLLSFVSLFSLVIGSLGSGTLPAFAQDVRINADTIISFSGFLDASNNPQTMTIKTGSLLTSYVVNPTSLVITTTQNGTFIIEDNGKLPLTNQNRAISTNDASAKTECTSNGTRVTITSPTGTKTVTIQPTNTAHSCGGGGGATTGGGGSGGGAAATTTTTTTTQTAEQQKAADQKAAQEKAAAVVKETIFVFKDGKFVAVTKEEAAKIEAEAAAAAKKLGEEKPAEKKLAEPIAEKPAEGVKPSGTQAKEVSTAPLEPPPAPQAVNEARAVQVEIITRVEAPALTGASSVSGYLASFSQGGGGVIARNEKAEDATVSDILPRLNIDLTPLLSPEKKTTPSTDKVALTSAADLERTVAYISYGTQTTKEIGAGERAGALNSYIAACGKMPQNEAEWSDLLKIASGRFPSNKCDKTKGSALINFQRVFGRLPNPQNANDQAALTIIQYGLLPVKAVKADGKAKIVPNRDTKKEKQAIAVFRKKFRFDPKTATAWNVVRAIAYSGSKAK